ncbi:MAG TPA: hypothetical protein VKY57_12235 [Chitinispirillaceae bacterium]|nr:hypothetical protein [Chitinispirillaceae bacterium]
MDKKLSISLLMLLFSLSFKVDSKSYNDLPLLDRITIDSVTWEFKNPVPVGQFITGDYYVVGEVTVTSITPAPANNRNGSVVNPPILQRSGYDDRVDGDRFKEDLRSYPPIQLIPGDQLLSSVSVTDDEHKNLHRWLRERTSDRTVSPVYSISILTCLEKPVSEDAFRPSYGDPEKKIYYGSDINRKLLPKLEAVASLRDIDEFAEHFRRPWVDICQFSFDAPIGYMPDYGREIARAVGMASLMLMVEDYPEESREKLMTGLIQYGIDLWGMVKGGRSGWSAHGGHGSGRKWSIMFAGIMLGDEQMASPTVANPELKFGEDMQTAYDDCWTGADVVYTGHQGLWNGEPVSSTPSWGPYEHLHPTVWYSTFDGHHQWNIGENYRRCCTSIAWVGQALAARLMGAVDLWSHDPFFDYVDRWMFEDDSEQMKAFGEAGLNYSANWQRQGQAWDTFVNQMWEMYRKKADEINTIPKSGKTRESSYRCRQSGLMLSGNAIFMDGLKSVLEKHSHINIYSINGKSVGSIKTESFSKDIGTLFHVVNGVYLWRVR